MSKKQAKTTDVESIIAENMPTQAVDTVVENPLLRKIFFATFAVATLFVFFLASKTGINADEDFQIKYSESLVKWYATAGGDTSATNLMYRKAPMHYYGGFFEVIAGAVNHAIGFTPDYLPYHDTRHYLVAVFGLLAMLFTALAAREVAGWKAALIALGLMFFSPYFIGNAVMNPKDIPFCAGFAMAIYFMFRYFKEMPAPRKRTVVGLVLSFVIALGTRAGGILMIAYFGLFTLVHITNTYGIGKFFSNRGLLWSYVRSGLIVVVLGYVGALLFWPYGLISPLKNPLEALAKFDQFSQGIRVLFAGENVMSDQSPWNYAPESIFRTTPIIVTIGFILGLLLSWFLAKRFGKTALFMALFMAVFPVVYVIYKDSNMYNNWRHLLFIYPGMILTASLAFTYIDTFLAEKNKYFSVGLMALLGVSCIPAAIHIVKNVQIPYLYHNNLVGGVKNAYGNFETDYWGLSSQQAVQYLEQQGILSDNMQTPITIATNMYYPVNTYIQKKYGAKAKVIYVKYASRYEQKWDYGLFLSLFVPAEQLRAKQWPMKSATIHTVTHSDIPLMAIMKQDTAFHAFKASKAMAQNNVTLALQELGAELAQYPDNELALEDMANCQMSVQNMPEAKKSIDALLKIAPDNLNYSYMQGVFYLRNKDARSALNTFTMLVKKNPSDSPAYVYLAQAQAQTNDMNGALRSLEKAIKIEPNNRDAYELMVQVYQKMGNTAAANSIMNMLRQ